MEARMKNPASYLPEVTKALVALGTAARGNGVPDATLELTHLRASQINGCGLCLELGYRHARKDGIRDEQLATLSGWREAPYFTAAERAALALSEAITRFSDRSDPVPDEIWLEAKRHYDERALATLVVWIATVNLYNRINVTTRQVAGSWPG